MRSSRAPGCPRRSRNSIWSDSALNDSDVEWLLGHGARFRSLRRLVVEHTSIGSAAAERLRALGPEILHSIGDAPRYRYVRGIDVGLLAMIGIGDGL